MNSCENHLFPGSVTTLGQEGHFSPHLPVQDWSCHLGGLCVAQSKIRVKLGCGPSSAACLPQALFYIFIVWGQKRLLTVLKTGILAGIFPPIFLSMEGKEATPEASSFPALYSQEGGRDPGGEALCSEHSAAGACDMVPGTTANP